MSTERAAFSHIELAKIQPGRNVRLDLHGIADLADSLKRYGMLQPITVVPTEDGDGVEVLFGHRRFEAAKVARLSVVPCFLKGRGEERSRLLTQIAENFDREEMTPLDEALAFRDLVGTGMSQLQIAVMVHRSDFYVSTRLTLLKYPECVRQAVHERRISLTVALQIPLDLLASPFAVESLSKVLVMCELRKSTPVKDWITARLRAQNRTVKHDQRRRRRLEVDLEHYDMAIGAARRRGMAIQEWTEEAVEAAAGEANA